MGTWLFLLILGCERGSGVEDRPEALELLAEGDTDVDADSDSDTDPPQSTGDTGKSE